MGQRGFERRAQKNLTPHPPHFSIPFLCALHQNKTLHNFRKRGQRSIVERNIGLAYALMVVFPFIKGFCTYYFLIIVKLITSNKVTRISVSLKSNNRRFLEISLTLGSMCKICQFLLIMCLRSSKVLLRVTIRGNFSSLSLLDFHAKFHSLE